MKGIAVHLPLPAINFLLCKLQSKVAVTMLACKKKDGAEKDRQEDRHWASAKQPRDKVACLLQNAVGSNFISMEDLMERVKKEVEAGSIESIAITVGTQRRAILEAIAFGTFLRDVEDNINSNYQHLLTANPTKPDGPGGGGGSKVSIPGGL